MKFQFRQFCKLAWTDGLEESYSIWSIGACKACCFTAMTLAQLTFSFLPFHLNLNVGYNEFTWKSSETTTKFWMFQKTFTIEQMTAIHAAERTLFGAFQLHFHHSVCEGVSFVTIVDHAINVIDLALAAQSDWIHLVMPFLTIWANAAGFFAITWQCN